MFNFFVVFVVNLDGAIDLCEALAEREERDIEIAVSLLVADTASLCVALTAPEALVLRENKLVPIVVLGNVQNALRLQRQRRRDDKDDVLQSRCLLGVANVESRTHMGEVGLLGNLTEVNAQLL